MYGNPGQPSEENGRDVPEAASVTDVLGAYVQHSPFCAHLGMQADAIEPGRVRLSMPFAESLVTVGDVVHGGAISALADTAATLAAWSGLESIENARGTTVSLSVSFIAAAQAADLVAEARVVRRGRSICFCEVDVSDGSGATVAKGLVTYKLN
jgi:uncharacterized protein (TIGR00369 family)